MTSTSPLTTFQRLFIANRGEVALRIIRTAHSMGIQVSVPYTYADAHLPFVAAADKAILLTQAPTLAYLNGPELVATALAAGAQAIHPGYGFLSEQADFADLCVAAGLIFVGPSGHHIRLAGDKAEAKTTMTALGLPVLPSLVLTPGASSLAIDAIAEKVGFPCIIKPLAGGGGKGMHVVDTLAALHAKLPRAQREAQAAFGSDALMIEKFCPTTRHIEVQVFGDTHGNAVHLFERNCSLQRRHQKVVEEAPSPCLSDNVRQQLFDASLKAVRGLGYVNAGTMEFLVTPEDELFFLEMNTRLQVEHPVTEAITGLDLVAWQLRVADGQALPLTQAEIKVTGHAMEGRLYAEDPFDAFRPSTGRIDAFIRPPESEHHRLDLGYEAGTTLTPYYDPMIAKIIVTAPHRAACLAQFQKTLQGYALYGITTNLPLLRAIAEDPGFIHGDYTTGTLAHIAPLAPTPLEPSPSVLAAAAGAWARLQPPIQGQQWQSSTPGSCTLWSPLMGQTYAAVPDPLSELAVYPIAGGVGVVDDQGQIHTLLWHYLNRTFTQDALTTQLVAPLPGIVRDILVTVGGTYPHNTPLLTIEAMKTEYVLKAPHDITPTKIYAQVGGTVAQGALLMVW